MNHFSVAYLLAALGFFLFGLRLTETNLRQASGDRVRALIGKLTQSRVSAMLVGVLMTILFQSSTAATVMMVGLVGINYLSLKQATSVILGADIGTTLIVFLLASFVRINVSQIALSWLVVAFIANFIFRKGRPVFFARAGLGFGFVLYGLSQISAASQPLRESQLVAQVITAVAENPLLSLFFAAVFTALIQSSAAVIGVLISFAGAGILSIEQAIPFVMGANIGSTVMPFLAGLRSKTDGKRLGYIHVSLKVIGVCVALFLLQPISEFIQESVQFPPYQVAAFHIGLNIVLALISLPLVHIVADLATRFIQPNENDRTFGAMYLDQQALESPTLAFANVFREILRMAEIAQKMCSQVLIPFDESTTDTVMRLEELDDQVDYLDREIKFYLAKLSQSQFTDEQSKRQVELLTLTHNLEQVGDVITKEMLELAEKKRRKNVAFSEEGWKDIQEFHMKVMENFHLAINSFASGDGEIGRKVMRHKKRLAEMEQELGQRHLRRLHQGLRESFDTSSIHLDILSNLRRINAIISKMAYPVLDRRQPQ